MTLSYFEEDHLTRISKPINFSVEVEKVKTSFFSNTPQEKKYYENNYDIFKIKEKIRTRAKSN